MTQAPQRAHPILHALLVTQTAVTEVGSTDPGYMRTTDQIAALTTLLAIEAQISDLKARLLCALDDAGQVVAESGARDLPFWLHQQARVGIRSARGDIGFAHALERHPRAATALREGVVSAAQAAEIIAAVEALPVDLPSELSDNLRHLDRDGADVAARAEAHLLRDARSFGPQELRVLGRRILEVVAPEIADEAEARKLEATERRSRAQVRFTLRPVGDGTTRISGRIPNLAAHQLATMLDSLVNPRRTPEWSRTCPECSGSATDHEQSACAGVPLDGASPAAPDTSAEPDPVPKSWWAMPAAHKLGHAFIELLSRIPADLLPVHGSTPATLFVTVSLDHLRSGDGAALVQGPPGEDLISAAEARRLACVSNIIPAVLGTASEVLDLGRKSRLFSTAQATALRLRHRRCQGQACSRPASHCEVHHHVSWVNGGATDLDNALLLCSRCHHRAHDPRVDYDVSEHGEVVFTPRNNPP